MASLVPPLYVLDLGRSAAKVKYDRDEFLIPSYLADAIELRLHKPGPFEYILEYPGHPRMFLGELADPETGQGLNSRKPMWKQKYHNDFLWLGLASLYEAGVRKDSVEVGIPIPYNRWTDKEINNIKELFEGRHRFTMNGDECVINIERVHIELECAVAVHLLPEDHKDKTIRICEVGDRTINYSTFTPGFRFNERQSGTIDQGWSTIGNQNAESVANFLSTQVMTTWNPDDCIMLIGGVAEQLAPYIPFDELVIPDKPRFATARGTWEAILTYDEEE